MRIPSFHELIDFSEDFIGRRGIGGKEMIEKWSDHWTHSILPPFFYFSLFSRSPLLSYGSWILSISINKKHVHLCITLSSRFSNINLFNLWNKPVRSGFSYHFPVYQWGNSSVVITWWLAEPKFEPRLSGCRLFS